LHGRHAGGKVLWRGAHKSRDEDPLNRQTQARNQPRDPSAEAPSAVPPVEIEVTRGSLVESRHLASLAVVDPEGRVVLRAGDLERPVYPRSAIKPVQALALVETGAAEAFGLGDREIALACASHSGEPRHVELASAWLGTIGCSFDDLECGTHMPYSDRAAEALIRAGQRPSTAHNNCSGKHAGFLSVARHLGYPTAGYIRYEHPVQQRILGLLESMTGLDLGAAPWAVDGCGIPTIAMPLGNLALAMARLADPADQPELRQAACARVRRAMAAEPFLVAGSGRFCTRVMALTGESALIKTGAEGVYCAALTELGLGVALKVHDGTKRAAEVLMGEVLRRFGLLGAESGDGLGRYLDFPVLNRVKLTVGRIRLAEDTPL
jgi:L-asparaginase II